MPQNITELPYSNVDNRRSPDYQNLQYEKSTFQGKKQSMGYPMTHTGGLNHGPDKRSSSALANLQ